jgi:membrane protease YdiL (CAAX protease family)
LPASSGIRGHDESVATVPPASRWHTASLVLLIVAVAVTGTLLTRAAPAAPLVPSSSRALGVYVPVLIVQWSLVVYVARLGRSRCVLLSLLGRGWRLPGRAAGDVALALAAWVTIETLTIAWARAFGIQRSAAIVSLLPETGLERAAWVAVAASAGFCEEVVYRGYLQVQLTRFTGSAFAGLVLQAALFGVAHADQGLQAVPRVALCGLVLGALARARKSLWPGILCHVGVDLASGLLQ